MKLPSSIKVGAVDYTVVEFGTKEAAGEERNGFCDRLNALIRINTDRQPGLIAVTLVHEIMHAIAWGWGIHNIKGKDGEEEMVWQLGQGWAAVLRDNPALLSYLAGVLQGKEVE